MVENQKPYRHRPNGMLDPLIPELDAWKLVVPEKRRIEVLKVAHSKPQAGHSGVDNLSTVVASLLLARDLRRRDEICETMRSLPEVRSRAGPSSWPDEARHCREILDGGSERWDGLFSTKQEWP